MEGPMMKMLNGSVTASMENGAGENGAMAERHSQCWWHIRVK